MRILTPSYLPDGYQPGFVGLIQEEGMLEISSPSSCYIEADSDLFPQVIILRCTLRPIPVSYREAKVQLISENSPLESVLLYNKGSAVMEEGRDVRSFQWQSIAVEYTGVGEGKYKEETFSFSGCLLPKGDIEIPRPLYVKPFRTEESFFQMRATTLRPGQVLTSPPGVLNARILRGYGGYYQPGIPLEEIEQVYYALTSDYETTRVRLYTSSFLKTQHISPPLGGRDFMQDVFFSPSPQEEEYLSFSAAIAAGYARLSVRGDLGVAYYVSSLCERSISHPSLINIYFKMMI